MIEEIVLTKLADVAIAKYRALELQKNKEIKLVDFPTSDVLLTIHDVGKTNNKEFDKDTPTLEIENPFKKTCLLKEYSVSYDRAFTYYGMAEIYVGDELVYKNKKIGVFLDHAKHFNITLKKGKPIKPNESVRAYLKSDTGVVVKLSLQVTFGN